MDISKNKIDNLERESNKYNNICDDKINKINLLYEEAEQYRIRNK